MRKIEIFDSKTFELLDMCFQYDSVKVTRKFRGVGKIEIEFSSMEEGDKFALGNYVLFNGETYIVESVHKYKTANGTVKIEVFGSHINKLLEHRVLMPNIALEADEIAKHYQISSGEIYSEVAVRMVKECFTELVAPYNVGEWLERIASLDFSVSGKTLRADSPFTLEAPILLTEALNNVLSNKKLGYKITVDYDQKKRVFNVFEPVEKDVVFSEVFGNINDADYYSNIVDEKTKSIFSEQGSLVYECKGSNESGFDRKELIQLSSADDWKTSYKAKLSASFDIVDNNSFKYGVDYNLGDIVEYFNKTFNITTRQQISEIVETYDRVETVSISIGDFVPTIYDRLKGVL